MPILFSVVARGTLILAQFASCSGNFTEVTREVLLKVPPHDEMFTYTHGNFHFHYIASNNLVYYCISDDTFPRDRAFLFLEEIKRKYLCEATNHPSDGVFVRVLESEMVRFNATKASLSKLKAEVGEDKDIVLENLKLIMEREEQLDSLLHRAEKMAEESKIFMKTSQKKHYKIWWQNIKLYVIILVLISPLLVYLIGTMACGGLRWKNCVA